MTEKAHADYGASSSERWLACPGSVALSLKAPPEKESPYAEEGTKAHTCLEEFLKGKDDVLKTRKRLLKDYPKDMVQHAETAAYAILDELAKYPGAELLCETKVPLDFVREGEFGTVDASVVEYYGTLVVFDFKYGAGIVVDPTENSQLIYYALGIAHMYGYDFQKVKIVILQPRAYADDGSTVREWETTIENLKAWEDKFRKGIEACEKPNAPLNAGEHCRFCKAKPICPQISTKALADAQIEFDVIDDESQTEVVVTTPKLELNSVALAAMLRAFPLIEKWIDSVREHAFHKLERGEDLPGFKLVPKRGIRKWANEDDVAKEAQNIYGKLAFHEPQLKSPAQFEAQFKSATIKEWVASRVVSVSSGTTMVPETDPRPAVNGAKDDFDSIEDSESNFQALPDANRPRKEPQTKKKKLPKHVLNFKQPEEYDL